jgi:hypothetical protein
MGLLSCLETARNLLGTEKARSKDGDELREAVAGGPCQAHPGEIQGCQRAQSLQTGDLGYKTVAMAYWCK